MMLASVEKGFDQHRRGRTDGHRNGDFFQREIVVKAECHDDLAASFEIFATLQKIGHDRLDVTFHRFKLKYFGHPVENKALIDKPELAKGEHLQFQG